MLLTATVWALLRPLEERRFESSSENFDLSFVSSDSFNVLLNPLDKHDLFDLPKQLRLCA